MHNLNRQYRVINRQRGIGIIEVLVALLVVSIGVLGVAGLQLAGLQNSAGSFNRAKALLLAENMATQMRNNPEAIANGGFNSFDSSNVSCATRPVPYCQASATGAGDYCTPAELASFDSALVACGDWGGTNSRQGVNGSLPNGQISIQCDTAPCDADSTYTVSVSWTEGQHVTSDRDDTVTRSVQVKMRP